MHGIEVPAEEDAADNRIYPNFIVMRSGLFDGTAGNYGRRG